MTASQHAAGSTPAVVSRGHDGPDGSLFSAVPDPVGTLSFVSQGVGRVGWGAHAEYRTRGAGAAGRIQDWFHQQVQALRCEDAQPVVFVSLGFDDRDESVAVIPEVLLTRQPDGRTTSIVIGRPSHRGVTPFGRPGAVRWSDATLSTAGYTSAVAEATRRIRAGGLDKVVLSHDLTAVTENPVDERFLLSALAQRYPTCFVYAVDGLVGASPELFVRRNRNRVLSRVLAGTGWADRADDPVSEQLVRSAKDQAEHRFAVDSVAEGLSSVCGRIEVPAAPSPLVLANLTHLCTDIVGTLAVPSGSAGSVPSALELAALLHPSGAVGGHPTDVALQTIRELEPAPRGRYAAPIGWQDADGDGEFALALRGAEVRGSTVRVTAGGGIMADSDPEIEAREAQVKMVPIRDALES